MPRRTLFILFLGVVVSYACYRRVDHNPYARYFAQVMDEIDQHYIEPVDEQKLFEGAISGMVGELDRYSGFISRQYAGEFQRMILDQKFGGIGIEVSHDKKTRQFTVMTPIVGTPAYEAGIRAGDRIVAIDGRRTRDLEGDQAIEMLRGKPGEPVTLDVIHQDETQPHQYRLVRREISVDSVLGDTRNADDSWNYFLPGQDRIGYLRITSFGERTVEECQTALEWLSDHGMRGLILDLRDDPGGLLKSAIGICELFLNQGDLIVTTRGRDKKIREALMSERTGPYRDVPLVVLVNRNSASASEIVAAALQDHGRALIAGERSYGKGTVQNVIPIESGKSVLKLTIATYWRPSEKNIHRLESSKATDEWGVKPDPQCEVKLSKEALLAWEKRRRARDVIWAKGKGPPSTAHKSATTNPESGSQPSDYDSSAQSSEPADSANVEPPVSPNDAAGTDSTPPETDERVEPETDPMDDRPDEPATADRAAAPGDADRDLQLEKAVECLDHLIGKSSTKAA